MLAHPAASQDPPVPGAVARQCRAIRTRTRPGAAHGSDTPDRRALRPGRGARLGGVVGATVGNRTADREDRTVATIVGAIARAVIGNWIGRKLDEADRACIGHALELGKAGQRVLWTNKSSGVQYELIPG